jgi:hypothetical protein
LTRTSVTVNDRHQPMIGTKDSIGKNTDQVSREEGEAKYLSWEANRSPAERNHS